MQHVEVPVPTPKKDEVLLKLEATSLNPLDLRFQNGRTVPSLSLYWEICPLHTEIVIG